MQKAGIYEVGVGWAEPLNHLNCHAGRAIHVPKRHPSLRIPLAIIKLYNDIRVPPQVSVNKLPVDALDPIEGSHETVHNGLTSGRRGSWVT